ncbi:MAG: flagellar biosynthesis protein FlhA [Campylobacterota bacterium]
MKDRILRLIAPTLKVIIAQKDLTIVAFIIAILSIIIVPLPSAVLDMFLTLSLAIAVLVIMISIYVQQPVKLTTFPTILLIFTLYRLALNIATTRMILTHGHEGPEQVSDIISSFGDFVVQGNFVIGIIMFTILVLINFMVVTKGATRVAEVAARFTLDSMPGRQMAIDADLNAGMIDEKEARVRREEIQSEASFYGAMDGSSKFVKGDAVAGIIITLINIIGGILIGAFQHDLSMGESATTYTILTIGDGLVSQIPALMISTATGIIITRASKSEGDFANSTLDQLGNDFRVLYIVGFILLLFAMVPGLPTFSLAFIGFIFVLMAYLIQKNADGGLMEFLTPKEQKVKEVKQKEQEQTQKAVKKHQKTPEEEEKELEDILKVEMLELDLGYQLIKLADANQGGDILERIKSMRRKIAGDFGFLMPQVRIRDNLQLPPNNYQILLKGVDIGQGEIYPDKFLAMNSGMVTQEIDGVATKEPAFGLDAIWIDKEHKDDASINGYTVVDPATVISTHMSELVKKHSEELLTRQEVQSLLETAKKDYQVVVDDALKVASIGLVQRVLKALLHEQVPIKDIVTILETVADVAEVTRSVDFITEQVRARLSRVISNLYKDETGTVKLVTLETATEQFLLDKVKEQDGVRNLLLNVGQINNLVQEVSSAAENVLSQGIAPVVLIVDPLLRKSMSDIFERFGLEVVTLSHAEIDSSVKFEVLGNIEIKFS